MVVGGGGALAALAALVALVALAALAALVALVAPAAFAASNVNRLFLAPFLCPQPFMPTVDYLWDQGTSGHCRDDTSSKYNTKKLWGQSDDLDECLSRCSHYGNSNDIGTPGVRDYAYDQVDNIVVVGCGVVHKSANSKDSFQEGCYVNFNKQAYDSAIADDNDDNLFVVDGKHKSQ